MAQSSMMPKKVETFHERGFVLSMAILITAIFIFWYAQAFTAHNLQLRADTDKGIHSGVPAARYRDIATDLNTLLNQQIRVDENSTHVTLFTGGWSPSALSVQDNLSRYQTNLFLAGNDVNVSIFLDLNNTYTDGNITGFSDNGLTWKQSLDTQSILETYHPPLTSGMILDINILADSNYDGFTPWSLDASGDLLVRLRYRDTNSSHETTNEGWITNGSTYSYEWTFSGETISLAVGQIDGNNSRALLTNETSHVTVKWNMDWHHTPNDSNGTGWGYAIPLTIIGADSNVIATSVRVEE